MRCLTLILFFVFSSTLCEWVIYPNRWVYVSNSLREHSDLEKITQIVKTASEHGFNGLVLSSEVHYSLPTGNEEQIALLKELNAFCREKEVELIPMMFSVGYGGYELEYDRNFSAALPASIPLVVEDGKAVPITSSENVVKNGDL